MIFPRERLAKGKYRVLLVSDNSTTQISGVQRKYLELSDRLRDKGHEVAMIHSGQFVAFNMPRYKEVAIAWPTPWLVSNPLPHCQQSLSCPCIAH